jgi:hypothetical protein
MLHFGKYLELVLTFDSRDISISFMVRPPDGLEVVSKDTIKAVLKLNKLCKAMEVTVAGKQVAEWASLAFPLKQQALTSVLMHNLWCVLDFARLQHRPA